MSDLRLTEPAHLTLCCFRHTGHSPVCTQTTLLRGSRDDSCFVWSQAGHRGLLWPEGGLTVLKPTKSQASRDKLVTLSHLRWSRVILLITPLPSTEWSARSVSGIHTNFSDFCLSARFHRFAACLILNS